jgi:hypothetical protein
VIPRLSSLVLGMKMSEKRTRAAPKGMPPIYFHGNYNTGVLISP